ncbi:IclR family transcriptional regulator [Polynucleobacter sinensis]|jgi:DNA-binding IclR family transcriptional regulator|uniref:IclR family transcriptional regulator n=1 Tax=Polynucleobacter sinensis TaxID=1743157 RepID=UPI0009EF4E8A
MIESMAKDPEITAEAADESTNGVAAVLRALHILEAFGGDDVHLSLAELSRRTALNKTTVLRIARTLAKKHYLVQRDDGDWRLGRATGWLGACYQATFDVHEIVEPVLRELTIETGESASFYVREGNQRTCLARVDGPQTIRHHVRVGIGLPLELGAPGRVILAFSDEAGEPYEEIRKRGYHLSMGEREPEVSSVSAPIFGLDWKLLGSICISGPTARLPKTRLLELAQTVIHAANQLSYSLAGNAKLAKVKLPDSIATWHP